MNNFGSQWTVCLNCYCMCVCMRVCTRGRSVNHLHLSIYKQLRPSNWTSHWLCHRHMKPSTQHMHKRWSAASSDVNSSNKIHSPLWKRRREQFQEKPLDDQKWGEKCRGLQKHWVRWEHSSSFSAVVSKKHKLVLCVTISTGACCQWWVGNVSENNMFVVCKIKKEFKGGLKKGDLRNLRAVKSCKRNIKMYFEEKTGDKEK